MNLFKKRLSACLFLILLFHNMWAIEQSDSTRRKLKAAANITLNTNGIASIPAFSLDKPALIATVSLVKNRFSYEPVLAYGLEMKPWFIDNWLNYKFINQTKFKLIGGVNFSTFFTSDKTLLEDTTILKAERYFAFALTGIIKFTPSSFITAAYWSDNGQEPGTIRGHFLNLMYDKTDISLGRRFLLSAGLQFFYINYDGRNDGLFVTPKLSLSLRDTPFFLLFMATQAIESNIDPFPEFRWNIGIGYNF